MSLYQHSHTSGRPSLTLHVNSGRLERRGNWQCTAPRLAADDGVIVDRFLARCVELADWCMDEHRRIHNEDPSEGLRLKVTMPSTYTSEEKGRAVEILTERGWDVTTANLHDYQLEKGELWLCPHRYS